MRDETTDWRLSLRKPRDEQHDVEEPEVEPEGVGCVGVYGLSLVSFPVYFQRKRYKGSVGSSAVRDFRGAMAGRGEKGLLVTTGSFTRDAVAEANRDGLPASSLLMATGFVNS